MIKFNNMQARIQKLNKILIEKGLDALIVTSPTNIFYLTGFRGVSPLEREAILLIATNESTLITTRLYQTEANRLKTKDLDVKIATERNEINKFLKDLLKNSKTIAFEEHDLKFSEFRQFKRILNQTSQYSSSDPAPRGSREASNLKFSTSSNNNPLIKHKLIPTRNLVEDLRIIKTADEIKNIEKAQLISQRAFDKIIRTVKIGQTEVEIAQRLSQIIKSLGAQGLAFDPIIASGSNSAKPHHITSDRRLTINDVLLLDFGAKYKNYCADLTRTIFIGRASDRFRNIYTHVLTSQKKALLKIKSGIKASHAHKHASSHFKKHQLDSYFLHSLGHGVGLEVHEKPSISSKSKDILKEGMVFSVEPGLYFPAWGGVRIEDLVTIRNGNAQILGKSAQLIQITP